jgi:predicted nuclease of predicted toxin-antitoxin system
MKILLDMNISPLWKEPLAAVGWQVFHWSEIGDIRAPDVVIMTWARENDFLVFTHDLDFGALLANTRAEGPSVIQIRAQDILPEQHADRMIAILKQHQEMLTIGALLIIDEQKSRLRILPLR